MVVTYVLMRFLYAADDTSEGAIVQRKGRFKVTSADPSPMVCITWHIIFVLFFEVLTTQLLEEAFFVR